MANIAIRMLGREIPEITIKELNKLAKSNKGYLLWTNTTSPDNREVRAISLNTLKEFLGLVDDGR